MWDLGWRGLFQEGSTSDATQVARAAAVQDDAAFLWAAAFCLVFYDSESASAQDTGAQKTVVGALLLFT